MGLAYPQPGRDWRAEHGTWSERLDDHCIPLLITLIPSIGNATIYAYLWRSTQSLAVASVYHSAYDEVREAIEHSLGFGPLVSIWEMLVTTILGAVILWKGSRQAGPKNELKEDRVVEIAATWNMLNHYFFQIYLGFLL